MRVLVRQFVPTEQGTDLPKGVVNLPHMNMMKVYDGHIRIENLRGRKMIVVDVFNSKITDPSEAHVTSEAFPYTQEGAKEATDFIKGYGFPETIEI